MKKLIICFTVIFQSTCLYASNKQLIGWLEQVDIEQDGIRMNAKIDTGADTTSINAKILKSFTLNDENWLIIELTNKHGKQFTLKQKLLRYTKIKQKQSEGIKRPVIELSICLGAIYRKVQVNLAKRNKFKYQLLIGRDFLKGLFIVDVAEQYLTQPNCHNELLIKQTGKDNAQ